MVSVLLDDTDKAQSPRESAWATHLKGKGVIFKSDVIHSPVCRMAACLDSEGNSILLHRLLCPCRNRPRCGAAE